MIGFQGFGSLVIFDIACHEAGPMVIYVANPPLLMGEVICGKDIRYRKMISEQPIGCGCQTID